MFIRERKVKITKKNKSGLSFLLVAGHGDDMMYLSELPPELALVTPNRPQDFHMKEIMVNLWTNFASTG